MLKLRFIDDLSHEVIDNTWVVSDAMVGLAPLPGETVTLHFSAKSENYKVTRRHWNLDHKNIYDTRIDIHVKHIY